METYNLAANLALLRSYSLDPSLANEDVVSRIVIQALMNQSIDGSDLRATSALVSDKLQNNEKVSQALRLASALDSSSFEIFWDCVAKKGIDVPPGFLSAATERICQLIEHSFQRIKASVLSSYLNIKEAALKDFASARSGWIYQGDHVLLPKSAATTSTKASVTGQQDLISLASIAPVLRSVTVGF